MRPFYLAGVPKSKRSLYVPDFTADSILDIDFNKLKKLGVKHVLLDLDLTLRKKMSRNLEPEITKFLIKAIKQYGFESISIASNNMLNLTGYGKAISAKVFQPFFKGIILIRKPNKLFFERIIKNLNAKPNNCVMIGDKLRGDVFGGNNAGMFTVLVKPKGSDYFYDRILFTRFRERKSLAKYMGLKEKI